MRPSRFALFAELWRYGRKSRKTWLSLLMLLLLLLGLIVILTESSAVTPFIYALF